MEEYINTRFSIKIDEGITFVELLCEFVEYTDIDAGIKKRLEMSNGRTFPIVTDLSAVKTATPEAKKRMADKDGEIGVSAVAVIVRSKIHRILIELFNIKYKKKIPLKIFTNKEKAVKWAGKYIQKNPEPIQVTN